jgi:hydrogenase expression/formation protein HypD
MKYVDEYRDGALATRIAATIAAEADPARRYSIMEFCGGHTHAICRYGIEDLLPDNVDMIHGPGCPVCVLPIGRLDMAIELARRPEVILCAYGDMMRVPGSDRTSLMKARAQGADIRMVYGSADALRLAQENPGREVIFFAIGFETTTPTSAVAIKQAAQLGLRNFSVFANHVLTPSAIQTILDRSEVAASGAVRVDGFIGPGHVSTIIGSAPYERFARDYHRPIAVSGFEPLDIMQSILMLVRQLNEGRCEVENQFSRAVTRGGNAKAQALVEEVFELRDSFEWRGLGTIPNSALQIREAFADRDAERRWQLRYKPVADNKACACGEILRGAKKPLDCKIFGTVCTPENPMGSCMVSPEGSCAAYYLYGRWRDTPKGATNLVDTHHTHE